MWLSTFFLFFLQYNTRGVSLADIIKRNLNETEKITNAGMEEIDEKMCFTGTNNFVANILT